jgi:endonuclease/exonuclease/phosphatase family metal-dependent hydrolase
MKWIKFMAIVLVSIVLTLTLLVVIFTLCDYKPKQVEPIGIDVLIPPLVDTIRLKILTWNIGYAGLDKNMDFFYDGGKRTRTSLKQTCENLDSIRNFLLGADSVDFIFLQEIDQKARRTYSLNEADSLPKIFPAFHFFYANNYNVLFVPVPLCNPMGHVVSGLATLARKKPAKVERIALPGKFEWPTRLFMLDRCFLLCRYPLTNGKELLIINTHNSAFDKGGLVKKEEMRFLKQFLLDEYQKGNYIIAGGDWNQTPPGLVPLFKNYSDTLTVGIKPDFMPTGWHWAYDAGVATNRCIDQAYNPQLTPVTLIDFFLVSPNIQVNEVKAVDKGFSSSDHNPVFLSVQLIQPK